MHERALATALAGDLEESEDFVPRANRLEAEVNVAEIVGVHHTSALKEIELCNVTPTEALHCCLTFAQEQLALACGREIAGSMALEGLGKLHAEMAAGAQGGLTPRLPPSPRP